ncbi:MAG TPA: hypothetical protein VEJ84_22940, partial [Acidimicrobiales bacterium]|nr:hypothetical protein [Acidimicrobiales bacterium]
LAVIDGKGVGAGTRDLAHAEVTSAGDVCGKLAAVLTLIDRFDEARAVALDGLARTPVEDTLRAARFHLLLALIEFQDNRLHAEAEALEAAEKLVGPCGLDDDQERVDVWLGVQLGKVGFRRRGNELERAASVLASVRPLVDARGNARAVAGFYRLLAMQHILERRYRIDAGVVEELRRAANAVQAVEGTRWDLGNPETVRFSSMLELGTALTWYGDLAEARRVHNQVLAAVERAGTANGRGVALTELAVTAWRHGDLELVRELVARARRAAVAGANLHFVTAATAALEAWVAWRDERPEQVIALGTEALDLWSSQLKTYPFRCVALFPLAAAYLDLGQIERAVDAARQTLEPTQVRLPDELEAAVQAACDAWDDREPDKASRLVGEAVALAGELRYA